MNDIITILYAAIASGTIILYATIGEIITERSGILNLGVEGIMLMGAFFGFYVAYTTESLVLAKSQPTEVTRYLMYREKRCSTTLHLITS